MRAARPESAPRERHVGTYLISIILVESLAGVRLMGVCLEALRLFNLGWHGRDALKADLKDSDLSGNRTP